MHCFPHGEAFLLVSDLHAPEQAPKYRAALVSRMCSWQPRYNLPLFGHLISLGKANICILSAEEASQALVFPEGFLDISPGFVPHLFQLLCATMQEM